MKFQKYGFGIAIKDTTCQPLFATYLGYVRTTFDTHADADRLHTRGKAANIQRLSKQIGVWRDQKLGSEKNDYGITKGDTACLISI